MDEHTRYARQRILEGVGEAGQALFEATQVVCEGEGPLLQTAAAYLEAAGFCLAARTAHIFPGFCPMAWQAPRATPLPVPASACRQRGFLGHLPCACPDGFDFWVLMGCLRGKPGFLFARGQYPQPQLEAQLEAPLVGDSAQTAQAPGAVAFVLAAWAALAFEKLALGLPPKAGGGSIGPGGEAQLWGLP